MLLLTTWDYQGDYTKQFGAKWAGTFGDMFCRAVRNGAETPREVLEAVERKTQMALQDSENGSERFESYRKLQNSLKTSDACDFAEFILERVSIRRTDAMPLYCGLSNTKNHTGEFIEATTTHLIVRHDTGKHLCHFHTAIERIEIL